MFVYCRDQAHENDDENNNEDDLYNAHRENAASDREVRSDGEARSDGEVRSAPEDLMSSLCSDHLRSLEDVSLRGVTRVRSSDGLSDKENVVRTMKLLMEMVGALSVLVWRVGGWGGVGVM